MFLKIKSYLTLFILLISINTWSQQTDFVKGNEYILDEIKVTGLKNFNEQTVINYTTNLLARNSNFLTLFYFCIANYCFNF